MLKIFKGPLKDFFWTPKASPKPAKPSPKTLQNGAKMPQKSMCKTACIFEALLYWFFSIFAPKIDGFLNQICMQCSSKCQKCETSKISIFLRKNWYFQGFEKNKKAKSYRKCLEKCMFFGTSILEAFWDGFGTVLGGQNRRFSHFFRYFFDVELWMQLGRAKNRKKRLRNNFRPYFGVAAAVRAGLGGRI